jgi:L-aminopeptidase/D-esterase-like protein
LNATITAVRGVLAGHATLPSHTGVTALLFPAGARGAVHVPGSASGTREMGALDPSHIAGDIHAICLSGGSAFGLAAADGVMAVLEARGIGFETPHGRVPIVPAAILFDLHTATARPDRDTGSQAASAATDAPLPEGRVGAGTGARVAMSSGSPVPGGVGGAAVTVGAWTVGAVAAVNAVGSVFDPDTATWVAGGASEAAPLLSAGIWRAQTTLIVVATDAPLDRGRLGVMARMASAGLARTLFPAFTPFDGDTVFAVSTTVGPTVDPLALMRLGDAAAACVARAIVRGVRRVEAPA